MIPKISLLAAFAALPLVLTGCGGDSASTTSSQNTVGQDVKFGENSQDLGSAPYFFMGTKTITGFDGTFSGTPSPVSTPVPTAKALAKVTLTLTGELIGAQNGHPAGYMLTISMLNTNGAAPAPGTIVPPYTNATVYQVGVAKDVFNDVYCFAPNLAGPVNKVGTSSMDVFINSQVATVSGPIKDFTVNIPTAAGTSLAPYTETIGTTSLATATLVADNGTLAGGGTTQPSTAASTSAKFDIVLPWMTGTPTLYWKTGIGLVEGVARYNWVVTGAAPTQPAAGAATSQNADYSITPMVLNSIDTATKYNYGPIVTGFVNPEVAPIPRGTN